MKTVNKILIGILIAVVMVLGASQAKAAEPVQICQHGKCKPETDDAIIQCAIDNCEEMAAGVYMCKAEVCVDRDQEIENPAYWRINVAFRAIHFSDPDPETGFTEHKEDVYGLSAEYQVLPDLYLKAGWIPENSYRQETYFVGAGAEVVTGENYAIGIEADVASGYKEVAETIRAPQISDGVIFVAGPSVRIGGQHAIKSLISVDFVGLEYQFTPKH